ncbi:MAG: vitamin B12-dependent ribonucleotide reductase [Spirochaetes bacterium]|nr:vitamin B12-dependent ribonucleotide reductase [Spirochaetota bacterium]
MLKLSDNAKVVLEKRYLLKNEKGELKETPEKLFERVSLDIAKADILYDKNINIENIASEFYDLMTSFDFLPNSPTLMNAGTLAGQLAACFVLPIEDSIESIFDTIKYAALIHKTGGGTGFSFSRLRPRNDIVKSTFGVSSGPVSFMEVFNAATNAIKQGGKRRGANMGILRVDHPDIEEFITCKNDVNRLTNFNISVALTDKFMEAYINDRDYELINPRTKSVVKKLSARKIFDLIVENAWRTGEPGIIFIDEINRHNPTPDLGEIESTNPCGEQPLLGFEACNLGSLNLSNMLKLENKKYEIDWNKFEKTIYKSIHFLDNVIDRSSYPLEMIDKLVKGNRKIGLGVMGWADMLFKLRIPYNSEEALSLGKKVMKFIQEKSFEASCELAQKRGVFPNWEKSIYKDKKIKIRNATRTTIAPTGTISIIAGTSSGIEPVFALAFYRTVLDNNKLVEYHPYFLDFIKSTPFYNKKFEDDIAEHGCLAKIDYIPQEIKNIFVTAHEISPKWHVEMQSVFQQFTDNAVSKTINFPSNATIEDVKNSFLLAYNLKCKGITIYRDKSREGVLHLGIKSLEKQKSGSSEIKKRTTPRPRPSVTKGKTIRMETGCGHLYVTINEDDNGLVELFATMGKAGGCAASQIEAISRLVSLSLRADIDPDSIIKQLKGIRCPNPSPLLKEGKRNFSCADSIAKALEIYLEDRNQLFSSIDNNKNIEEINFDYKNDENYKDNFNKDIGGVCPECGGTLMQIEGCSTCLNCGFSKCS